MSYYSSAGQHTTTVPRTRFQGTGAGSQEGVFGPAAVPRTKFQGTETGNPICFYQRPFPEQGPRGPLHNGSVGPPGTII